VFDREREVTQKEKWLAKKEEHLDQREEVIMELHEKLKAYNVMLEKQWDEQAAAVAKLQKLQQELNNKASNIALAEEDLKEKDASLEKRATDLTWQEEDLAFREEMWERRNKMLDEYELEAEEKEKQLEEKKRALEEQVQRFQVAQAVQATQMAPGPQVVEAMRKTLEALWAEQRAGA
jgi:DNA repair exonuclease SbcCD ATPase subunit